MIAPPFGTRQDNTSLRHHERMVRDQNEEGTFSLIVNQKSLQFRGAHGPKLHLYLIPMPPAQRQL